jgi:hypothetical protein
MDRCDRGFTCQTARRKYGESEQTHLRIPAVDIRPGEAQIVAPENKEGAGKAGCLLHPQPHAQNKKHMSKSPQVRQSSPAFPARWF